MECRTIHRATAKGYPHCLTRNISHTWQTHHAALQTQNTNPTIAKIEKEHRTRNALARFGVEQQGAHPTRNWHILLILLQKTHNPKTPP